MVAVHPSTGADYDLALYDDPGMSVLLTSSAVGGSTIDFLAVNSTPGRRAVGDDYFPKVHQFGNTSGVYTVEQSQGTTTLAPASSQLDSLSASKLVAVRDTVLTGGTTVTISATCPQDVELFLTQSTSDPKTWVVSRSKAVRASSGAAAGGTEKFTYPVPATAGGTYGVVLLKKSGASGTCTLTRT